LIHIEIAQHINGDSYGQKKYYGRRTAVRLEHEKANLRDDFGGISLLHIEFTV